MLKASGREWRVPLLILPGKIVLLCRKGHQVVEVLFTTRAVDVA